MKQNYSSNLVHKNEATINWFASGVRVDDHNFGELFNLQKDCFGQKFKLILKKRTKMTF